MIFLASSDNSGLLVHLGMPSILPLIVDGQVSSNNRSSVQVDGSPAFT